MRIRGVLYSLVFLGLVIANNLTAQHVLDIYISSSDNKAMFAAQIQMKGPVQVFTGITDTSGHCRLNIPSGQYIFKAQYLGFKEYVDTILINNSKQLKIQLTEIAIEGKEVIIEGKQRDKNIRSIEIGVTTLQQKEISNLPKMIGETDVIKALQYTPGVTISGEGNSGIYVRGGANDQNLLLLDDAVIFNPAHLLGIFSVFNTDILQQVKLYKSGIPASYGGRISSVLDIKTTEGNFNRYEGQGTVGIISSKFFLTGPIIKEKVNFFASLRKSYLNEILYPASRLIIKETNLVFQGLGYDFFDLNAGINCKLNKKDFLQLRFYTGEDVLTLNQEELLLKNSVTWSNLSSSFQWRHIFNDNTSFSFIVSHSRYDFDFFALQEQSSYNFLSDIQINKVKISFAKYLNSHSFKFGAEADIINCLPNQSKAQVELFDLKYEAKNRYFAQEYAAFINDEFSINDRWKFNLGYRHTLYQLLGPYKVVNYNDIGEKTDSMDYSSGENVVFYHFPDVRVSARYLIHNNLSLKASFSIGAQYLNQLTISSVSLPSDFWIPSTPKVNPQHARQASLGVFKNFSENTFETSAEIFYKTMDNQIEFNNSIFNTRQVRNFEDNLIFGKGKSYGFEVFVRKITGNTTGWLSYTLSRSLRFFNEINSGNEFPAKYDRIHDLSVVLTHKLNKRWIFSAVFIYATGEAYTLPMQRYMVQGNVLNEYGDYNGFRLPDYHRLDISATWLLKQKGNSLSELNFSVYNVYNRQNPLYIYNETRGNLDEYELRVTPKQLSLLPIIPSISWTYKF
jgi:hypothetical protein